MKDNIETPEGYREIVSKSMFKRYSLEDRKRLGIEPTKKTPVYSQATWTLNRYEPVKVSKSYPVLVVPSLINRNYIMDLMPGHSMIEAMKAADLDVFMLDWGVPDDGIGHRGIGYYTGVWVRRAIRHIKKITGFDGVQLVGQCIGGVMAALYASHPELKKDVKKLFLLTTPLDFEDSGLLSQWTSVEGFDVESMTAPYKSIVPATFFHASFPLLDVKKQMGKYRTLLANYEMTGFKEIWEALDIWGTDNVPFTRAGFIELIHDFYQKNTLYKGEFKVLGEPVSLKNIDMPVLSIAAKEDHVFDEKSARAIKESKAAKDGKLEYHVMPAGHVTVIAAHPIRTETYKIINEFLTR